MAQTYSLLLYGISAGAGVVGALALSRRWNEGVFARLGTVLFVLIACVASGNELAVTVSRPRIWTISLHGMLSASLFPVAWLYIRDLTSDVSRPVTRGDVWHFAVPLAFVPQIVWSAGFLSSGAERSLWESTTMSPEAVVFATVNLGLSIAWVCQITLYTLRIARELARLNRRLRQVFANVEGRDLAWVRVILILLGAHLPLVAAHNLGLLNVSEIVFAAIAASLSCAFAAWAIPQMPAFQISEKEAVRIQVSPPLPLQRDKYAKSLLDEDRMYRIQLRIDAVLDGKKLYLDPNLSLSKLSTEAGVSENNLSQTFTRLIGANFFDYVNSRRVEMAKHLLSTTDASVTEIALEAGFNARSAFYSAFKVATGMTPSAYRDACKIGGA